MNEHVEDKVRGWASIIIIFGWIGAALLFILAFFALAAGEEEEIRKNYVKEMLRAAMSTDEDLQRYTEQDLDELIP